MWEWQVLLFRECGEVNALLVRVADGAPRSLDYPVIRLDLNERRAGLSVLVVGVNLERRARHEDVALGRVHRRHDLTGQHDFLALDVRVRGERR